MIKGEKYIEKVESYFHFLTTDFNLELTDEKIKGNTFYDVRYRDKVKVISISYENLEDYFLLTIFLLENGELPSYDDKTKTLHLNKLNEVCLSKIDKNEISLNNKLFSSFLAEDEIERKLLKSSKELRLCLNYLNKSIG